MMDSHDEDANKVNIDLRSFLLSLEDVAQCPVCLELPRPPVTLCVNGHGICSTCKATLNKCPTCREPFCETEPRILNEILQKIPKVCKFYDRGCRLAASEDHEIYCMWRKVKCIFLSRGYQSIGYCDWEGPAVNLCSHFHIIDYEHIEMRFIEDDKSKSTFNFSNFNNLFQTKSYFVDQDDRNKYFFYHVKSQGNFCLYIKHFPLKKPKIITYFIIFLKSAKFGVTYKYKIKATIMATPEREVKLEENTYCMRVPLEEVDECVDENGDLYVSYKKITEPL